MKRSILRLFALTLGVLLIFTGCGKKQEENRPLGEVLQEIDGGKPYYTEEESSVEPEPSSLAVEESLEESDPWLHLTVAPGAFARDILEDLVALGIGDSVESLMELIDTLPKEEFPLWGQIEYPEDRPYSIEGYIAPGSYDLPKDDVVGALSILLHSWEVIWTEDMEEAAGGTSFDDLLTMASIVEYESSLDVTGEVKPNVASVVQNRLSWGIPLEMDVTVFYLENALAPYRTMEEYEALYDTYEIPALPEGPINSPSLESLLAAISPAETGYLFFIYDAEGNYYFAEDWNTHLENIELYLD